MKINWFLTNARILSLVAFSLICFKSFAQNGSAANPFTQLGQAQSITAEGVYHFNLTGTTFSTYVRLGGWVQVAIDYGGGVGSLPQSAALNNATRGILNTTCLSKLTTANRARIIVSTGAVDVTSTNATHLSRIRNNQALSVGGNDNGLSDSWTGTGSNYLTTNAGGGCNAASNNGLHQRIIHIACNTAGMHWIPIDNMQQIANNQGNIASNRYFQLLVQAPSVAVVLGPTINTQPLNTTQNLCLNGTSTALSVSASGTGTVTYQWYKNTTASNSGGTLISGATASTYTPPTNVAGTSYYYVIATDSQGNTTSSVSGAVNVSPLSVAGNATGIQTICSGTQPAAISLSGFTGNVQWQVSTDNSTFTNVSGATSATLTGAQMGVLTSTRYYRAIVTSGSCSSATSNVITVSVTPLPVVSSTTPGSVCGSGSVTLGASATSGVLNWFTTSTGGSSLGTGTSFTTPIISSTTTYYVDVTANGCVSQRLAVVATVNELPINATNLPVSSTVEVLVVGGGGSGGYRHAGGGGGGGVVYDPSFMINPGNIAVTVGNGGVGNMVSGQNSVFSTITAYGGGGGGTNGLAGLNGGSGGGGSNGSFGGTGISGQGNNGGNQNNGNGCCFANGAGGGGAGAAGANTSGGVSSAGGVGLPFTITGTTVYYGGGGGGGTATSTSMPGGNGGGGAGGRSNSLNGSNGVANTGGGGGGGGANGGSSGNGGNGGSGVVIVRYPGPQNATGGIVTSNGGYTIHTFNTSGTFSFNGGTTSAVVPNVTSCSASAVTFTGTVSAGLTLDWYDAAVGGNLLASGVNSFTTPVISSTTTYYVEVRNSSTGCVSASRLAVTATINSSSSISTDQDICPGSIPSNIVLSNASGTIQWQSSTNNLTFTNLSGQTGSTLTGSVIGALNSIMYYRAVITNGTCVGNSPVHTINLINPTLVSAPSNGDLVWKGTTSNDWSTIGNWWQYNGASYVAASAAPTTLMNVIVPANQTCVLNQPNTNANNGNANSLRIENGATLTMGSGNLNVAGNWVNNGSFVPGTGTVTFAGSGTHSISGSSANHNFNNLTMNKTGEIILSVPAILSGSLTLTNGRLNIGNFNLDLPTNTINGGNANSYVLTSGTGVLMRNVGASTVNFPVGRGAYNPAALTNSGVADKFNVRVIDNVTDIGTNADSGPTTSLAVVNRTWMVNEQTAGGSNVTLRLGWNGAGEEINGFQGINAFIAHYMTADGLWDNIGGTFPNSNGIETNGITSFSPFTISSSTAFAPLPVELMSFSSSCEYEDVAIMWTTASENNSMHFEVEVSQDAMNWEVLSIVQAAQFSTSMINYAIKHEGGAREKNYYRLKQVDQNGDFKVYNVIYADCGSTAGTPSTFPNPSRGDFAIDLNGVNVKGTVQMVVLNSEGKEISSRQLDLGEGVAVLQISNMDLQPGVYYLKMIDETGRSFIIKHCFM